MKKIALIALLVGLMSGCTTVTIRDHGTSKISSTPDYSTMNHFFFWGLIGHSHVNVTQICGGKTPAQLQTEQTFLDNVLAIITLGIYYPRSAYVWCNEEGGAN
jgi:Bor protein